MGYYNIKNILENRGCNNYGTLKIEMLAPKRGGSIIIAITVILIFIYIKDF